MKSSARYVAVALLFLIVAPLLPVRTGEAQNATPPPATDLCQAGPETWMPGPMGPGMMLTPGAMGPGMMTPGAMGPGMMTPGPVGPGMMSDVNLMVATMLLANDRIDEALVQTALTRLDRPEITQFAQDVARSRNDESSRLQQWREVAYPGTQMTALDQMLTYMAGMMGPMMQGTPWPGMGQMPGMMGGNAWSALCTASGPVDDLFVDALLTRDQMVLAMLSVMQPSVTAADLQQAIQDAVTSRQQEVDRLLALQQAG